MREQSKVIKPTTGPKTLIYPLWGGLKENKEERLKGPSLLNDFKFFIWSWSNEKDTQQQGIPLRSPRALTIPLGDFCSPWFPECWWWVVFWGGGLVFWKVQISPPLLFSFLHPPPPRETEVPEDQRKGQRAAPAWPGATKSFLPGGLCELTPTPRNPNKVTTPMESIFPFMGRLCSEPRCVMKDFIQSFLD